MPHEIYGGICFEKSESPAVGPGTRMMLFKAYKEYPFPVPVRVKFFNLFRYFFTIGFLENYLVGKLLKGRTRYWHRLIPPLYFYRKDSKRIAERNGIRFELDVSNLLDHSIYFCTIRDPAWDHLFKLLHPAARIIDVGANIGYLTLMFASRCPDGIVYAFEPDTDSFRKLRRNVDLNGATNVKLFNQAVGATRGTATLYKMYANLPGTNRILSREPDASLSSEEVEVATLDDYANDECFNRVDLIKVDVEGFELFVLRGARRLIDRWRPVLFVELVDLNLKMQGCSGVELVDYIAGLGYYILDAKTMTPLKKAESYYTDVVCFHNIAE